MSLTYYRATWRLLTCTLNSKSSHATPSPPVNHAIAIYPEHPVRLPLVGHTRIVSRLAGGAAPNRVSGDGRAPGRLGRG